MVSSESIKASISYTSIVTPKGSFSKKQITSIYGFIALTNFSTFLTLKDHGSSISFDFLLISNSVPDIPMYIFFEAERTVNSNKT